MNVRKTSSKMSGHVKIVRKMYRNVKDSGHYIRPEIVPKHERTGHYLDKFRTIPEPFFHRASGMLISFFHLAFFILYCFLLKLERCYQSLVFVSFLGSLSQCT